jgi:DNA-binding GntR family transcriptional regulator
MAAEKRTPDEYELLRNLIISGQVQPNERLVETDYAERLGTNRANIRRALARLEQEGLVVCEPFRGARVRLVTPDEAVEIFEVRGVLEVLIVRQAVDRVTEADKALLRTQLRKIHAAFDKKDPMAVGRASRELREQLWKISGHATGAQVLNTLNSQLVRIWYQSVMMPGRAEAIVSDMDDIVEAVCAGSHDKAARAVRRYHDAALVALKKALKSRESFIAL